MDKAKALKELLDGEVFLKYGAFGYPKQKHVYFDGVSLRWRASTKEGHAGIAKSTEVNSGKCINLKESEGEIEVTYGRKTKAFKRFSVSSEDE